MEWLIWVFIWVIFALISGSINSSKGRSYGEGFALGLFLGFIGLIIVALRKDDEEGIEHSKLEQGIGKKCPYCAEIIKQEAVICRYCGKELPSIKNITSQIQDLLNSFSNQKYFTSSEIEKWRAGFSYMGWFESIGSYTSSTFNKLNYPMPSVNSLICVTYTNSKGSRLTGIWFNNKDLFSTESSLISDSKRILLINPNKKIIETIEFDDIQKLAIYVEPKETTFTLSLIGGNKADIVISFSNIEEEKFVNLYFERIKKLYKY